MRLRSTYQNQISEIIVHINKDKIRNVQPKSINIFLISLPKTCSDTQQKHLTEGLLMSTHNTCIYLQKEMRKISIPFKPFYLEL